MTRLKKLLTAGLLCCAAAPVFAQEMGGATGPGSRWGLEPTYSYGYHRSYEANGFWPAEAAVEVVGGAIGTAGAIASAPFRAAGGSSYASMGPEGSFCASQHRSFDPASGTYLGRDGRRHLCR